jgi:hypothetical protein
MVRDTDQLRAVVNTVMSLWITYDSEFPEQPGNNILSSQFAG